MIAVDDARMTELLELSGRLIMENGGEIFRVEETVRRMGFAMGLKHVDCFAVPSGLFITWQRKDGPSQTIVTRVHR